MDDGTLVPCSPHKLPFAKVECELPLCLPTWVCSLPEPCPAAAAHGDSCWPALHSTPGRGVPCALHWAGLWCMSCFLTAVQTSDQSMLGMGVQDSAC